MNKDEFYDLFYKVTTDPPSTEYGFDQDWELWDWYDFIMPPDTLFSMTNSWLVKGVRIYIEHNDQKYLEWTRGEVGDFEQINVGETEDYWWFFAINTDVSECQLGKLKKENYDYTQEELLEGFVNYCANYGPKYS